MTTYTKLQDGSWGLRGSALTEGSTVKVTKRSGETKRETVGQVVWTGNDGVSVARIARAASSPRRSWASRIDRCSYCGKMRTGQVRPCREPCPESAVPGQLYETCGRRHYCCDGCYAGERRDPTTEETEAQRAEDVAVEAHKAQRVLEAERKAAEKAKAVEDAKVIEDRIEALTVGAGLVCTDTHPMMRAPRDDTLLSGGSGHSGDWIRLYRGTEPGSIIQVRARDAITRAWGTPEQVDAWALDYAREQGITEERALAWRARYTGCAGQRIYDAILREAGHDVDDLDSDLVDEAREQAEQAEKAERDIERQRRNAEYEERCRVARVESAEARRVAARECTIRGLSRAQRILLETLQQSTVPVKVAGRRLRTLAVLVRLGLAETRDGQTVAI